MNSVDCNTHLAEIVQVSEVSLYTQKYTQIKLEKYRHTRLQKTTKLTQQVTQSSS